MIINEYIHNSGHSLSLLLFNPENPVNPVNPDSDKKNGLKTKIKIV
jgi:hypothetical protein